MEQMEQMEISMRSETTYRTRRSHTMLETERWTKVIEAKMERVELSLYVDGDWAFTRGYRALHVSEVCEALNDYCPGTGKVRIRFLGPDGFILHSVNGERDALYTLLS